MVFNYFINYFIGLFYLILCVLKMVVELRFIIWGIMIMFKLFDLFIM